MLLAALGCTCSSQQGVKSLSQKNLDAHLLNHAHWRTRGGRGCKDQGHRVGRSLDPLPAPGAIPGLASGGSLKDQTRRQCRGACDGGEGSSLFLVSIVVLSSRAKKQTSPQAVSPGW